MPVAAHFPRRLLQTFALAAFIIFLVLLYNCGISTTHEQIISDDLSDSSDGGEGPTPSSFTSITTLFQPGAHNPKGAEVSRVIVIPCMKKDEVAWIEKELPDIDRAIYFANDSTASLHPPKNKGHEVMIYLTYIIDNYVHLPDVSIFMHAHRWTHHNNGLLDNDAVQMISRLSNNHVIREGYMNMRCQWEPGCPEWLHPMESQSSLSKQEEAVLSRCWGELFPLDPIPYFLAQPCCAQFALSKERILSIPLSRYMFYRNWVLTTPLSDYISGRIWEYSWQYVFTGKAASCPAEHMCYCDGFGVCFGGENQYRDFLEIQREKERMEAELDDSKNGKKGDGEAINQGAITRSASLGQPIRSSYLSDQIQALNKELELRKTDALERGDYAKYRAQECGRPWKQGDSF